MTKKRKVYLVSFIDRNGHMDEQPLPQKYGTKYPTSLADAKQQAKLFVEGIGGSPKNISVRLQPNIAYRIIQGHFNVTFGNLQLAPATSEHYKVIDTCPTKREALHKLRNVTFLESFTNGDTYCFVRKHETSSDFEPEFEKRFAGLIIQPFEY